jgi:NRPS condensation-like uncharacterized protein/uncharacterized membrane protein YdjX (TVP38/TMEM64 family)
MKSTKRDKSMTHIILASFGFLALVVIITLALLPYIEKLSEPEYQAQFKSRVESMGFKGLLAIFGIQILQIVIAFIPGEPIEILAGVLYGTFGGLVLCLVGCAIASTIIFTLSKKSGKPLLNRFFGEEKVKDWQWIHDKKKIETITFILFFIPGTPKDMLTYVVGISDLKLSNFIVISTLARIPSILSSCMVGATIRQGKWEISIAVFVLTGIIGLVGIRYKNRMIDFCQSFANRGNRNMKAQCLDFMETVHIEKLYPLIFCHLHFEKHIDIDRLKYAVQQTLLTVPQILCSYDLKKGRWIDKGYTVDKVFICSDTDIGNDWCWDLQTEPQLKIHVCRNKTNNVLTIGISHILCDGTGFLQYLYLLSYCYNHKDPPAALQNQRDIKPLLDSIDIRTTHKIIPSFNKTVELPFDKSGDIPFCLTRTIEKTDFLEMRRKTKVSNCTINDVFLTVYARVVTRVLETDSIVLPCPVDLRRFWKSADTLTIANMTGIYKLRIIVKPDKCFETTLLQVHKEMAQLKASYDCFIGMPLLHLLYNKVPLFFLNRIAKKYYTILPISYTNLGVIEDEKLTFDGNRMNHCFLTGTYRYSPDFQLSVSTYRNTCTLNCTLIGSDRRKEIGLNLLEQVKVEIAEWLKSEST